MFSHLRYQQNVSSHHASEKKDATTQTGPVDGLVRAQSNLYHQHKTQIAFIENRDDREILLKELESNSYPLLFIKKVKELEFKLNRKFNHDFYDIKLFKNLTHKTARKAQNTIAILHG